MINMTPPPPATTNTSKRPRHENTRARAGTISLARIGRGHSRNANPTRNTSTALSTNWCQNEILPLGDIDEDHADQNDDDDDSSDGSQELIPGTLQEPRLESNQGRLQEIVTTKNEETEADDMDVEGTDGNQQPLLTETVTPVTPSVHFQTKATSRNEAFSKKTGKEEKDEKIKQYLNAAVASLPKRLGSTCKTLAHDMLRLTNSIDERNLSVAKVDATDPKNVPRSLRIKIDLKVPDSYRETDVYKSWDEKLQAAILSFQVATCNIYKNNAYDVIKHLQREKFIHFLKYTTTISECYHSLNKKGRAEMTGMSVTSKEIAKFAVYKLVTKMTGAMKEFFNLSGDEGIEIYKQEFIHTPIPTLTAVYQDIVKRAVDHTERKLQQILPALTSTIYSIQNNAKQEIEEDAELKEIIELNLTKEIAEATNEALETQPTVPSKELKALMEEVSRDAVSKKMKEMEKRFKKNSSGGRNDQASRPASHGKSTANGKGTGKQTKALTKKGKAAAAAKSKKESATKNPKSKKKTPKNRSANAPSQDDANNGGKGGKPTRKKGGKKKN